MCMQSPHHRCFVGLVAQAFCRNRLSIVTVVLCTAIMQSTASTCPSFRKSEDIGLASLAEAAQSCNTFVLPMLFHAEQQSYGVSTGRDDTKSRATTRHRMRYLCSERLDRASAPGISVSRARERLEQDQDELVQDEERRGNTRRKHWFPRIKSDGCLCSGQR